MANTEMYHLNQTLKEISHNLKTLTRVTEALNSNLVELGKRLTPPDEEIHVTARASGCVTLDTDPTQCVRGDHNHE